MIVRISKAVRRVMRDCKLGMLGLAALSLTLLAAVGLVADDQPVARPQAAVKVQPAAKTQPAAKRPEYGYHSGLESSPDKAKWVQIDLGQVVEIDRVILHACHDEFGGIYESWRGILFEYR